MKVLYNSTPKKLNSINKENSATDKSERTILDLFHCINNIRPKMIFMRIRILLFEISPKMKNVVKIKINNTKVMFIGLYNILKRLTDFLCLIRKIPTEIRKISNNQIFTFELKAKIPSLSKNKTQIHGLNRRPGVFSARYAGENCSFQDNINKVLTEMDLTAYGGALQRNGFFGPCSYYMNHAANADYSASAINGGFLEMPILFLAASYDYTCECLESDLAKPMSDFCKNLTTITVDSGHWMAQEKPVEVNAALIRWLTRHVTQYWPFK